MFPTLRSKETVLKEGCREKERKIPYIKYPLTALQVLM